MMKLQTSLLNLLFPPKCPLCGRVQDVSGVCPKCEAAIKRTGEDSGVWEPVPGLVCAAPLWYEGVVREGLLRFKFRGAASAAEFFGGEMCQWAAERFSGEFDMVTWAPVSRKRLRQRGYDQARLLAESACRAWGVRPVRLLKKVRNNPAQSGLEDAAARRENVKDVYKAVGDPAGRRVLLVDDICTTGSTLEACAGVLKAAGAARVLCLTAARTPKSGKTGENGKE